MNEKDREDFVMMKADIKHTKEDIEEIKQNSERVSKEVDKIVFHLIGDPTTETKGWISKLTRFDYRLTVVEKTIAIGSGLFAASLMYLVFVEKIFNIVSN